MSGHLCTGKAVSVNCSGARKGEKVEFIVLSSQ
jgi:hypothetical protein